MAARLGNGRQQLRPNLVGKLLELRRREAPHVGRAGNLVQ
jgi:hypothetical protein